MGNCEDCAVGKTGLDHLGFEGQSIDFGHEKSLYCDLLQSLQSPVVIARRSHCQRWLLPRQSAQPLQETAKPW